MNDIDERIGCRMKEILVFTVRQGGSVESDFDVAYEFQEQYWDYISPSEFLDSVERLSQRGLVEFDMEEDERRGTTYKYVKEVRITPDGIDVANKIIDEETNLNKSAESIITLSNI